MTTLYSDASLRVLAADIFADDTTLQRVLGTHLTLITATTVNEAVAAIDRGVDVIVCNIHFDICRMFDLLRRVKADPKTRSIPFVCFRDLEADLGASVTKGLTDTSKALGAATFLDMYTLQRAKGRVGVDIELRDVVVKLARNGRDLRLDGGG